MRQRLNAFGNEESPLLLGKKRGDYWEEVQSSLGAASTQREYNNLLSFENRDLEIRELKNPCMSLFREELDQHPDLLPKCLARNPREAVFSFLEEIREDLKAEVKTADGDCNGDIRTLCIDGQNINLFVDAWINPLVDGLEIELLREMAEDLRKSGGTSYYFQQLVEKYFRD